MLIRPSAKYCCTFLLLPVLFTACALFIAGCASPYYRRSPTPARNMTLVWTGDDGLSLSFKRAIQHAVDESHSFVLTGYAVAGVVIDNTTNVLPVFDHNNNITGFTYKIAVYTKSSRWEGRKILARMDGKCDTKTIKLCAEAIVATINRRFKKGKIQKSSSKPTYGHLKVTK